MKVVIHVSIRKKWSFSISFIAVMATPSPQP